MAGDDDDRPTSAQTDDGEAEEEALPDWRKFAQFAKSNKAPTDKNDLINPISIPFIPKRGEKDFEPLTLDSSSSSTLPSSSTAALLSSYQQSVLLDSRNALFAALSSGSRHHSSRGHNSFTWRPEIQRATCDDENNVTYGVHFGTMGGYSGEREKVELRVEEAILLKERGALELWKEDGEGRRVPMSVQQAWSELLGKDDMTPERFQIYAYLRRLGFVVTRARDPPPSQPPSFAKTASHSVLYYLRLPFISFSSLVHRLATATLARLRNSRKKVTLGMTRLLSKHEGRLRSLVDGRRWCSYDQIFNRLQIIPTSWDTPLPRSSQPHTQSVLTPMVTVTKDDSLPSLEEYPYQTFFNVYKPSTKFRKSNPPKADFEIVVINATTTPLPDLFELSAMFDSVSFPEGEDTLLPPPRNTSTPTIARNAKPPTRVAPAASPRKPSRPKYTPPPPPTTLQKVLSYIPFLNLNPKRSVHPPWKKNQPSIYPRLKVGRRDIIVAVVDNGTSSFLRFGESEFGKLTWAGDGRKA